MEIIKKSRHRAVLNREREKPELIGLEDKLTTIKRRMDENTTQGELKKCLGDWRTEIFGQIR
ncbi:MAG: hypothetical protein QXQ46_08470 [Thermoplasmatales archaeon]